MKIAYPLVILMLGLVGCAGPNSIVTTAQSVVGISVSENPATQLYEARAGVVVSQIAFVPCRTNGTGFVPDVIQEFRVNNLFAGGMVYQRLAVGSNAVSQPGASLMFAKDAKGGIGPNFVQQLQLLKQK